MPKKVTIIYADNTVYVDGRACSVDCSHLPSFLHAVQWYGDAKPPYGEIEWAADQSGRKMPNTRFADLTPYQYLVDAWQLEAGRLDVEEKVRVEAAQKAAAVFAAATAKNKERA